MKNSSRKNAQNRNGSGKNKKGNNQAAKQCQTADQNQSAITEAEAESKKAVKAKEAALSKREEKPVLYEVRTTRDSDVIKAYITFTYRVFHPAVTTRMVFYGLLVIIPGFIINIQALKIACWVIGALIILLGLFRQYISLALTKSNDSDYKSGAEFTYEFTQNDASFYKNGELMKYLDKYKGIDSLYHDEGYYYIRLKDHDFYILPKDKFTTGESSEFDDFIYNRCRKTCRWIPAKFSNRMKQRRAVRKMNSK